MYNACILLHKKPAKPQDFLKTPCKHMGGVGQSIRGSTVTYKYLLVQVYRIQA